MKANAIVLSTILAAGAAAQQHASLALVNGKIWTVNEAQPRAEAVACIGSRIVAVGSTAEIRAWIDAKTAVIDLGGRMVTPGFNDAHVHFYSGGSDLARVQLREARSEAEFRERIREFAAKLPAGRTLILVSDGFSLQPAREFYAVASAFLPKDERFKMAGPTDLESRLQAVIQVAAERDVRIYSVDSRGLAQGSLAAAGSMDASSPADRTAPSVIRHVPSANRGGTLLSDMDHEAASAEFQNGSGMEQLARATGGVYFHDSNDMLKQFRSALADGREYYLLAYIPKNRVQDGKFRKITVEVADKKLHVQAKFGYWAEPAQNGAPLP